METSWFAYALAAAVFAASTAVLAKLGVGDVDPDVATLFRTAVVLVALAGLLAATGRLAVPRGVPAGTWIWLTASGLATGASWLCWFRALKLGDAARVAPIDKLSVVMVAVFSVVFLGERLSALNWLGVALVAVGALLVAVRP